VPGSGLVVLGLGVKLGAAVDQQVGEGGNIVGSGQIEGRKALVTDPYGESERALPRLSL
jgi:hypothetical protein